MTTLAKSVNSDDAVFVQQVIKELINVCCLGEGCDWLVYYALIVNGRIKNGRRLFPTEQAAIEFKQQVEKN